MSVTRVSLVTRFPEFSETPVALVNACIEEAELMVDSGFFGTRYDMAVTHYAAHLIAINPMGEMARLDKKGETTTYLLSFERIKRALGAGFRVI